MVVVNEQFPADQVLLWVCSSSTTSTARVRQCEECHGNALALLKCSSLVPLEKTNNIPQRCLRTEFGPLSWRDTTPLLLLVCFAGTPRSKHYIHMAETASGQARISLQYPHSNWKWDVTQWKGGMGRYNGRNSNVWYGCTLESFYIIPSPFECLLK